MARRPLPRILSSGTTSIARSRERVRTAADNAADVLHPLITIARGLRLLAAAGRQKWADAAKDRRGPALFLAAACVMAVALIPYGPVLALITVMAVAAWKGRDGASAKSRPNEAQVRRLQSLYEALVPYLSVPEDPSPLFTYGGEWDSAFSGPEFDRTGRLSRLRLTYPAYFTDSEPDARSRIEQLLHAKSGRGREYLFEWNEEANQLTMSVPPTLSTSIAAQRFATAPGETLLGFTDNDAVQRTMPVRVGDESRDAPAAVWRTGPRSTEPHLLVAGAPGSGVTNLLRSIALQALRHGDVLIVEGSGTGEYSCLADRAGLLALECGPVGAASSLEWAAHETERRLTAAHHERQSGRPAPDDTKRPLWILLDRPSLFGHPDAGGRPDPHHLLEVPLRHGGAVHITVVVADHLDSLDGLSTTVRTQTRARVILGCATPSQVRSVLGAPPHTTPMADVPPGRGYARLGTGEVLRLQVPATPDPYDGATSEAHRQAVLDLLPEPNASPAGTPASEGLPEQAADSPKERPAKHLPDPGNTADPVPAEG